MTRPRWPTPRQASPPPVSTSSSSRCAGRTTPACWSRWPGHWPHDRRSAAHRRGGPNEEQVKPNRGKERGGRGALRAVALAGAMLLLVASCGGDDDDGDEAEGTGEAPAEEELTQIDVGVVPVVDVAPLYLGIEQGFFEE